MTKEGTRWRVTYWSNTDQDVRCRDFLAEDLAALEKLMQLVGIGVGRLWQIERIAIPADVPNAIC